MSSTLPPDGPQGPEYLEQGSGSRLGHEATPQAAGTRKTVLVAAAAVVGLVLVGGGIWAATSFLGTGPQPAEALPASTLGYASVDLDPSGAQKIEALSMIRKFPALKDQIGLDADDDIRRKVFEEILQAGDCEGTDYADDIEPWIGDRAAVAAVDAGEDRPAPVLVLQVKDEDKADEGLGKLQDCAAKQDGAPSGGWVVDGDWVVIAESEAVAQGIVDDAAKSSLADDADYQGWMDEVGDAGIVNLYAAPAAGRFLADNLGGMGLPFGAGSSGSCEASSDPAAQCETDTLPVQPPGEMTEALREFKGMAATIRFDNGAVELEVAGDPGVDATNLYGTDRGDDVLATLPDDTAAAIGVGFADGWFTQVVDQMAASSGGEMSADEMMSELARGSGLDLPGDAETLAGESAALSLGSDFDPETLMNSSDGSEIPVGVKVKGDPDAIEAVLDKVRGRLGPDAATFLGSDADGDMIALGPNPGYRSQLLENGTLGDSSVFQDVVREAERATAIVFVNFDAGDGWLADLAGGDPTVEENLEPLGGLGISVWREDDAGHAVLRLTTD